MSSIPTVPQQENEHRARWIAGLRELAHFPADHPEVAVDEYGPRIVFSTAGRDGDDQAAIERVRAMAAALGVDVNHHRDGHWSATRDFGVITFGCSYVERAEMAQYNAALSYQGTVQPAGGAR